MGARLCAGEYADAQADTLPHVLHNPLHTLHPYSLSHARAHRTDEPIPAATRTVGNWAGGTIKLYKATYPANDPSEDRSTLVIGEDFVFCGVWDGHGGTPCSEYA